MRANRTLPAPMATQLNKLFNDMESARAERLWLGANPTEPMSWLAVWLLGLLSHFAVAAVHFDKPRAGAVALTLLALATVVPFWSLGVVDDPCQLSDELTIGCQISLSGWGGYTLPNIYHSRMLLSQDPQSSSGKA